MMRIFTLLILAIVCVQADLKAQLLPLFLNNRDHVSLINPAMSGMPLFLEKYRKPRDYVKTIVGLSSRFQWTKFGENSPLTNFARFHQKFELGDSDHFYVGECFFYV